ncbi:hypothetical protein [Pseudonocardia sp. DLS-67]
MSELASPTVKINPAFTPRFGPEEVEHGRSIRAGRLAGHVHVLRHRDPLVAEVISNLPGTHTGRIKPCRIVVPERVRVQPLPCSEVDGASPEL